MADPKERKRLFDPSGDERGYVGSPQEEIPGHTPGSAEGDDEDVPHRKHPYPDPGKTPGSAEG
ncbi:MAG: hypothetical protein L0Y66_15115 [Myxococcaceae bacterium]|nr:hypothetical protein [Myxococcaceae bacterium]MCI0670366.1 hypothetical protein [Myxococcaceae bacterium]